MLSGTQAAAAECEDGELRCRVAVEELSPGGQPRRRQSLRTAELSLGWSATPGPLSSLESTTRSWTHA